jgi:hypothetical protein
MLYFKFGTNVKLKIQKINKEENEKFKVIKNTFPKFHNVKRAEVGDVVIWERARYNYNLIRTTDNEVVFKSANVDKDGLLKSGKCPTLHGVIAKINQKDTF